MREERREMLAETAAMYRTLSRWRREKTAGEAPPTRDAFRALARRFPGALRELDTRPLEGPDGVDARAESLESCARGEREEPPWARCLLSFHAWMRAALWLKPRLSARGERADEEARAHFVELLRVREGLLVDERFVRSVANPPGGRLKPVVLERVCAETGEARESVERALFLPLERAGARPEGPL